MAHRPWAKFCGASGTWETAGRFFWNTEFSERLTAYQKLIDTHRGREAKFQEEKQAALEELRRTWMLERAETADFR